MVSPKVRGFIEFNRLKTSQDTSLLLHYGMGSSELLDAVSVVFFVEVASCTSIAEVKLVCIGCPSRSPINIVGPKDTCVLVARWIGGLCIIRKIMPSVSICLIEVFFILFY